MTSISNQTKTFLADLATQGKLCDAKKLAARIKLIDQHPVDPESKPFGSALGYRHIDFAGYRLVYREEGRERRVTHIEVNPVYNDSR